MSDQDLRGDQPAQEDCDSPEDSPELAPRESKQGDFGRYRILGVLGRGGFGTVHKAWDPDTETVVAVKLCTAQRDLIRRRFQRETRIAKRLVHPNIPALLDSGSDPHGRPYMVQEFIEGEDLDRKIASGEQVPSLQASLWLLEAAEALAFAHSRGVIHRDVKPSNIRITPDDRAIVLDFGAAKLLETVTELTAMGETLGTLSYLSPEAVEGKGVTARSDLFSFGVVAYELLSGTRPFHGDSVPRLLLDILNRSPQPPSAFNGDCPAVLDTIILRCLQKDPEARYESFLPVARALRRLLDRRGAATPPLTLDGESATSAVIGTVLETPATEAQRRQAARKAEVVAPMTQGDERASSRSDEDQAEAEDPALGLLAAFVGDTLALDDEEE